MGLRAGRAGRGWSVIDPSFWAR